MSEPTDWAQTPGGLLRNRGLVVEPLPAERPDSPARMSAKRQFTDAWAEVLTVQEQLRDAGWAGEFVSVSSSIPPELVPLTLAAKADRTTQGMEAPGRPDDELVARAKQAERERFEAARAELPRRLTGRADCVACRREAGPCDAHQGEGYSLLDSVR